MAQQCHSLREKILFAGPMAFKSVFPGTLKFSYLTSVKDLVLFLERRRGILYNVTVRLVYFQWHAHCKNDSAVKFIRAVIKRVKFL